MTVHDIHRRPVFFARIIKDSLRLSLRSPLAVVAVLKSGGRRSVNNSAVVMEVWKTSMEEIGMNFADFSENILHNYI